MKPTQDHFPVFEANQVLTNGHLNDLVNYLDEQERLSRANLIGIGIVCGLEVKLEASGKSIHLSKGCGVASEGYLIVEPEDLSLTAYREYVVPAEVDYPRFKGMKDKLWELFPEKVPDTTPLSADASILEHKAVILFLELKKQDLRNCSPNNCDDKGSKVTASVKPLLVGRDDLKGIIATANELGDRLTASDLESALLEQLELPDLRLPRFDVPNTDPATSDDVLAAFLTVFQSSGLARRAGRALSAAYKAFRPFLLDAYPRDPFVDFQVGFSFLDNAPTTTDQVRFLPYYYDLFDDLLRAYDEFRWKGEELVCACCPPEGLFPRHLMLGLVRPEKEKRPSIYRHTFIASSAVSGCSERTNELVQLFRRLVEMTKCFTNVPALPTANDNAPLDPQIRITPSTLGDKPLSGKAIPYYYQQDGRPPLYQLWAGENTRRSRANQNLSYRFDEFEPPAPPFVSTPLRYDLEPHNFLRIEGHLGKDYRRVLRTLLSQREHFRLPIEVIALRTGAYDETQAVDLRRKSACFQDLEALYDVLREELLSSLAEGIRYLYDAPFDSRMLSEGIPSHPLLKAYAPNFRYRSESVGAWYEKHLTAFPRYIEVDQNRIFTSAVVEVYFALFRGKQELDTSQLIYAVSIYYFSKLGECLLPGGLDALVYADFENRYQDLLGLVRFLRSQEVRADSSDLKSTTSHEELIDHFDQVLLSCKLDSIKSLHREYARRIEELRKRQFLTHFLHDHPGIQHKAGVPLGGTFIIVYHQDPAPTVLGVDPTAFKYVRSVDSDSAKGAVGFASMATEELAIGMAARMGTSQADVNSPIGALAGRLTARDDRELKAAINRISSNPSFVENQDIHRVLKALTNEDPMTRTSGPPRSTGQASEIIATTVDALAPGAVIADFYLPYLTSCNCANVQFVLPKACNLPCAGIARRRGYRFWLPEPDAGDSYKSVNFGEVIVRVESPAGTIIDLSNDVKKIVEKFELDQLRPGRERFLQFVQENWLKPINRLIADKTQEPTLLTLNYASADPPERLGTLWIEHFECLKFDIMIEISFPRGKEEQQHWTLMYSPSGTTLVYSPTETNVRLVEAGERHTVTIPAFDGIRIDKCNADEPPTSLCETPTLTPEIVHEWKGGGELVVTVKYGGHADTYLWEVEDAMPGMANGSSARFRFARVQPATVKVTAFTNGCRATFEKTINPGKLPSGGESGPP